MVASIRALKSSTSIFAVAACSAFLVVLSSGPSHAFVCSNSGAGGVGTDNGYINSVACGTSSVTTAPDAVAVGYEASAQTAGIAVGYQAAAASGIAVGYQASSPNGGLAIGDRALAQGSTTVAVGDSSQAIAAGSTVLGHGAISTNLYGVAIGINSRAVQPNTGVTNIISGDSTGIAGANSISVVSIGGGNDAFSSTRQLQNVGAGVVSATSTDAVNGSQLYAVGTQVNTNTANIATNTTNIANLQTGLATTNTNLATTNATVATQGTQITTLQGQTTTNTNNIATNTASINSLNSTVASQGNQINTNTANIATNTTNLNALGNSTASALGGGSTYTATSGVSAPRYVVNGGTYNDVGSAIGAVQSGIALSNRFFAADGAPGTPGALALGIDSTAIGNESIARGDESAALGSGSTANGYGATAVGSGATTGNNSLNSTNYGTAVGFNSVASGEQSSAFGYSASATGAGSTAIGAGAVATRANQIALGTASSTYTAAGISSAASRAAQSGQTQFITTDSNGNLASSAYGPQDIAGLNNSITGLTNSVGILGANVAALSNRVDGNQREARQGIAMAAAMAQAPMPSVAGKTTWKVNNSYYKNYGASSLSVAHRLPTNVPMALTAGVAVGFRSSALFTAGLQGEF